MRKKNRMILNTGTTSLVLIFAVLALVTFAALSLSSASAGERLTDKMAERTTRYYEAENRSMQVLAQVEQMAGSLRREGGREDFLNRVQQWVEKTGSVKVKTGEAQEKKAPEKTQEEMREEKAPEKAQEEVQEEKAPEKTQEEMREEKNAEGSVDIRWEEGLICWEVPVSERQQISAEVRPLYERGPEEASCRVEQWSVTETGAWQGEQALELYR